MAAATGVQVRLSVEGLAEVLAALRRVQDASRQTATQVGATGAAASRSAQQVGEAFQRMGSGLATFGATWTAAVTVPMVKLGSAALDSYVKIDSLKRGLVAIMQDSKKAGDEMERLKEVAKLPGLGLAEALQGSVQLQAVGYSAEEARRYLLAFGNAIATVGGGKEQLAGVLNQLSQMAGKTKVTADDLKPIINNAPIVARMVKSIYGTSDTEQIQKTGDSPAQFLAKLVKQLETLPKVTTGPKNALENLSDAATIAGYKMGLAFAKPIESVTDLMAKLIDKVSEMADWFSSLPESTKSATAGFLAAAAAIGPLSLAAGGVITSMGAMSAAAAALGVSIGTVLLPIVAVGAAIGGVTYLMIEYNRLAGTAEGQTSLLVKVVDDFRNSMVQVKEAISGTNSEMDDSISVLSALTFVLKTIAALFLIVGQGIGTLGRLLWDVGNVAVNGFAEVIIGGTVGVLSSIKILEESLSDLWGTLKQAATGDIGGAFDALKSGLEKMGPKFRELGKVLGTQYFAGTQDAWSGMKDVLSANVQDMVKSQKMLWSSAAPGSTPAAAGSGAPGATPPPAPPAAAKQKTQTERILAEIRARLALQKQLLEGERMANEDAYAQGLKSLQAYYDKRRELIEREAQAEKKALQDEVRTYQAERARLLTPKTGSDGKPVAVDQADKDKAESLGLKIQETSLKIQTIEQEKKNKLQRESIDLRKDEVSLSEKIRDIEGQMQEWMGAGVTVAREKIAAEAAAYELLLKQQGVGAQDIQQRIQLYKDLRNEQVSFGEEQRRASLVLNQLDLERARIQQDVSAGRIDESTGRERIAAAEQRRIQSLREIVALMRASGSLTEEQQLQVAQLNQEIQNLADSSNLAQQEWVTFRKDLRSGFEGWLNQSMMDVDNMAGLFSFLWGAENSARSARDAIAAFGASLAGVIAQAAAARVAARITDGLFSSLSGDSESAAGIGTAAAKGAAQAAPLQAASVALGIAGTQTMAAGVAINTGAIALGISASQLMVASAQLAAANAMSAGTGVLSGLGALGMFDSGGYTGSGGTSDVAGFVHGKEFVFDAKTTAMAGPGRLEALRRQIRTGSGVLSFSAPKMPGYEGGGFVGDGSLSKSSSGESGSMTIGLEEGLLLREFKKPAVGRILVEHLSRMPKRANQALGGVKR